MEITNNWVHVSPGLVLGDGGRVEIVCAFFFLGGGGALLGDSKVEKWGDHQKKKFFINKSVEALSHKTAEIHFPDIYLIK